MQSGVKPGANSLGRSSHERGRRGHAALIWYLFEPTKLSLAAREALRTAIATGAGAYVSAISLIEIVHLEEKGPLPPGSMFFLRRLLKTRNTGFHVAAVDMRVALRMQAIARAAVPDMPDRIIAATSTRLGMPLVSRDRKIQAANLVTIW